MKQLFNNAWWNRNWFFGLLLVVATILAYQPAWQAGFIWDDDMYVTNNALLTASDGLWRIWFSTDSPSQYFPLVYTTFRLEYALWGLNPAGYHWFNILLHAVNALLAWRLLQRLSVPGAWMAAAVFALHPVNVESVAWITELKNVQSLFFVLLALLAWVRFIEEPLRWRWYGLALGAYVLALLSKTTACTLPAALLLILWLKQESIGWRRLAQIVPFVVFGLAMGLVTIWWERHHQGTTGDDFQLGSLERLLIAGRAVWFYIGKLLWPVDLMFIYPLWKIDPAAPLAYAGWLASAGLGAVIYGARRFVGPGPAVAVLYYVATLSPMLGFVMLYTFHFSFVADHYQYMAMLGPVALVAAGLSRVNALAPRIPWLIPVGCAVLLAVLSVLTWRQCRMYNDLETLWRTTARRNPNSYIAHNSLSPILLQKGQVDEAIAHARKALDLQSDKTNHALALINLGNALLKKGQVDEAIDHFKKAVELLPNLSDTHNNLGSALLQRGQGIEAIHHFEKALALKPRDATFHYNLGNALYDQGRFDAAITHYRAALETRPNDVDARTNLGSALLIGGQLDEAMTQFNEVIRIRPDSAQTYNNIAYVMVRQGKQREAMANYRTALELQPDNASTLSALAWLLATSSEAAIRNGDQAVTLAQRADQLSGGQNPMVRRTLAAAFAEVGRFVEARQRVADAIELAAAAGQNELLAQLNGELKLYEAGLPYHQEGKSP